MLISDQDPLPLTGASKLFEFQRNYPWSWSKSGHLPYLKVILVGFNYPESKTKVSKISGFENTDSIPSPKFPPTNDFASSFALCLYILH